MKNWVFIAFILSSVAASADMGFYKKDDGRLPLAIRKASGSVVQVVAPLSDTYEVYQRKDYASEAFEKKLEQLDAQKMILQAGQMRFCVQTDLPVCLVYDDIAISTGFIVFDSKHIATNRHADENLLINLRHELQKAGYNEAQIWDIFKTYPIPLKIARDLETISTVGAKHLAYARWFDETPPFFTKPHGIEYMSSDLIVITTENEVGEPLPIAPKPLAAGERFYMVGYPTNTFNRTQDYRYLTDPSVAAKVTHPDAVKCLAGIQNHPGGYQLGGDSNGIRELSVSTGIMQTVDTGLGRLEKLGSSVSELRQRINSDSTGVLLAKWSQMIFSDADSEHGGSGSPYLNEKGEVVGIHSVGMSQYCGNQASLTVSMGITWPFATPPEADFQLLDF